MMKKTCGTLVVPTFFADLFRSAAEAGPHDILKLYSPKGSIINISTRLEPNSPSSCYRLEVVATDCSHQPPGPLPFWPLALQCLRTADCWPSLFFHSFRGRACWGAWPFIDRKKVINSPSSGHFLSKVYANARTPEFQSAAPGTHVIVHRHACFEVGSRALVQIGHSLIATWKFNRLNFFMLNRSTVTDQGLGLDSDVCVASFSKPQKQSMITEKTLITAVCFGPD